MAKKTKIDRLFRHNSALTAALGAWPLLMAECRSEDEAAQKLRDRMARGRRPAPRELKGLLLQAPGLGLLHMWVGVFAVRRWYASTPLAGLGLHIVLEALKGADWDPRRTSALRLALFEEGYALAKEVPELEPVLWMLVSALGTSLAPDDDPVRRERGRRYLREHAVSMRQRVESASGQERSMLRAELARALANLGQACQDWSQQHDCDDPTARLEEALSLHEEAMRFPERMQDPEQPVWRYHSHRMRGSCRRLLALRVSDPARRLRLLEGAVEDAMEVVRLAQVFPSHCPDAEWIGLNAVNARAYLLRERRGQGLVGEDEARHELAEIEAMASRVRPGSSGHAEPLVQQMWGGVRRLAAELDGEAHQLSVEEVTRGLRAAKASLAESRATALNPEAVMTVAQDLERLVEPTLPAEAMRLLGEVLERVDVEAIGPAAAIRLMVQEFGLLTAPMREAWGDWDAVAYVEHRLAVVEGSLRTRTSSHAERRVAAGWIRLLVTARLVLDSSLSPLDWAVLVDSSGSSAWRSDVHFYGQGVVRWGLVTTEAGWRCDLYRRRWERDHAAQLLHVHALLAYAAELGHDTKLDASILHTRGEVFPPGTPVAHITERTGCLPERMEHTRDGIYVPQDLSPGAARGLKTRLLGELRSAWQHGVQRGWAPAEPPVLPKAIAADLTDWWASHPHAAVLVVGAPSEVAWLGLSEGVVQRFPVALSDDFGEVVQDYLVARDHHSFGSLDERGVVDAGASLEEALQALASAMAPLVPPIGTERIFVLARSWARHVPWQLLPGDAPVVQVQTLAPLPRGTLRVPFTALVVGGAAGPDSPLALGKAVLSPVSDRCVGPVSRDDFEALVARSAVVRLFAHGTSLILHNDAAGIELDEDDPRSVNRFAVSEGRMLDLRGARRVELWACESGRADLTMAELEHHDEPAGMDGALLLAGAEVVLSSLWMQYSLSAAMIAEAFALESAGAAEDVALQRSLRRYRAALAPDGCFAVAVREQVADINAPAEAALRAGHEAFRRELWRELRDEAPPEVPVCTVLGGARLGPVEGPRDARFDADAMLEPLRSPLAWAGWKLMCRSKEVMEG